MPEYAPVKKKKMSKREKCGEIAYDACKLGIFRICEKAWLTTLIITTPDAIIRALIIKFRRPDMRPLSRPKKQYRSIG